MTSEQTTEADPAVVDVPEVPDSRDQPRPGPRAEIGVIGGAGVHEVLHDYQTGRGDTPLGGPSHPPPPGGGGGGPPGGGAAKAPRGWGGGGGSAAPPPPPATARPTAPRHTGSTTAPTSGRCERWASARSSPRAPSAP